MRDLKGLPMVAMFRVFIVGLRGYSRFKGLV